MSVMHMGAALLALRPITDLPVTVLSAGVRQHSDVSVVPPCLIHVYMPNLVCPSVRLVWPNQSLDLARFPVAQVAFKELTDSNQQKKENKKL